MRKRDISRGAVTNHPLEEFGDKSCNLSECNLFVFVTGKCHYTLVRSFSIQIWSLNDIIWDMSCVFRGDSSSCPWPDGTDGSI